MVKKKDETITVPELNIKKKSLIYSVVTPSCNSFLPPFIFNVFIFYFKRN
jgi:hypothetical protein